MLLLILYELTLLKLYLYISGTLFHAFILKTKFYIIHLSRHQSVIFWLVTEEDISVIWFFKSSHILVEMSLNREQVLNYKPNKNGEEPASVKKIDEALN